MKVLYDWLKEFVDLDLAPAELRSRLSLAGVAVEGLEETAAGPLLDADLTINRPDCLSHYGMAREAAALERKGLKALSTFPWFQLKEVADPVSQAARVQIDSPDLCGRYTARVVRGVKAGPSPEWLRKRLEALGHGSISNIVDATNYVMLELGQPLHAFDLDRLAEKRIVVRRARAGEKLRTLDGIDRALTAEMCVIADGAQAVAIAGIMGGAGSEISSASRNVLLESAWFDPISVRRASKALGLRTEASTRFERGADPEMAEYASRRCASLIQALAGGEILSGVINVYPGRRDPLHIRLSRAELIRVMGADIPDAEVAAILGTLGFDPKRAGPSGDAAAAVWDCTQPPWRQDVTREIDLIEELARHHGLDKFPSRLHASKQPSARLPHAEDEDRLRERLMGLGYREIVSIPLVNDEEDALFRPEGVVPVRVGNPLAEDASLMRSTGLVTMAHALARNLNRGQRNLRLFEINRAYRWKDSGGTTEPRIVTIGATGLAREKGPFETERTYQFADLKGDLDQLGQMAGGFGWRPAAESWQTASQAGQFGLAAAADSRASASANGAGQALGVAGKLAQRIADRFKLRQDIFLAEFLLEPFFGGMQAARATRTYRPISRYPAVERDFSLVLSDGTPFSSVRDAVASLGIGEITSIEAVDLFRGKSLPAGKFSLLLRVTYQSGEGTLTDAQVNDFSSRILAQLERNLGATLRAS